MKSHKAADGKTYFHKFVNWVSELVGLKIKGTAFEEFLSHTDKILNSGNYAASIHNYGERYFTGKGYSVEQARDLTSQGVGLLRDAKCHKWDPDYVVAKLHRDYISEMTQFTEAEMNKIFETDPTSTMNLLVEAGNEPSPVGVNALATDLLIGRANSAMLDLLDPKVAEYVYARSRDVDAVVDMLRAATDKDVKGLVNVDADDMRPSILGTLDKTKKILEH